ncbi:MAG: ATP-binding protein [Candidatus Sphingomonas phytovorans]|nr:ATP-binding protein [Sphingomonas sp.]WEK00934.1 MAG: ATP-binding protein [Sphingomonas sp.]
MRLAIPRSLLGQFVALHVAVALAAAITLLWSASALLHQTADHFQRNLLRRQAVLSAASAGPDTRNAQPVVLTNGMAVSTIGADRRVERSYGPPRPEILAVAPLDRTAHFFRSGVVEGYSVPVGSGWIVVSQDDADPAVVTDDIVRSFLPRFALICLPIAALVPLIGALIARRMTLRMRAVSAIAATIGPRSLNTRLPSGLLPVEAEPLAEATNAALDRLAAAIHVQAAFAADVAHELRTPLAVVRLRADAVANPELRTAMMSAVDRAARVIAQLLALAEIERPVEDGGTSVDLHALAEGVVSDRAPGIIASGRSIALERADTPARVRGYSEALTLALENLIDNAARHTPPGTAIVVSSGPGALIAVGDNGDPIPEAHFVRLKDRLWRGAGANIEGSGIGLSIVERVAHAHHGALTVHRGSGQRGLVFLMALDDL